jgi:hypothetical protein
MTSSIQDDIFRQTFQCLQSAISGKRASDEVLGSLIKEGEKMTLMRRLEDFRLLRRNHSIKLSAMFQRSERIGVAVRTNTSIAVGTARAHALTVFQSVEEHEEASNRRLRELTYEIIGEYGKSFIRASRRYELISISDCKQQAILVTQLRWQRFLFKFIAGIYEKTDDRKKGNRDSLQGFILDCTGNAAEIRVVEETLRKKSLSPVVNEGTITAVVRFERVRERERSAVVSALESVLLANTPADFLRLESELIHWITPAPRSAAIASAAAGISRARSVSQLSESLADGARSGLGSNRHRLGEYLESLRIQWLCPASHFPNIWDDLCGREEESYPSSSTLSSSAVLLRAAEEAGRKTSSSSRVQHRIALCRRLTMQHTAGMSSNRLYFCLEERRIWRASATAIPPDLSDVIRFPVLGVIDRLEVSLLESYNIQYMEE